MRIPNVPIDKIVNDDGRITNTWSAFFQNLMTQMRLNLSDDGFTPPFVTAVEVLQLNTVDNVGRIVYNTTTSRMMINNSGTFENILT